MSSAQHIADELYCAIGSLYSQALSSIMEQVRAQAALQVSLMRIIYCGALLVKVCIRVSDVNEILMAGVGAATLFALALLASGQSSTIIATMAGQTVSEGFLRWRVSVSVMSPSLS